eukprot:CAMPEP_0170056804 /NCGR_PEP_ID=MMETSP0019_2-20121128/67_1 /TAXON_ID=98059 /ORGANISM="Dinobryon sp., Strain UTEXLB2267" /LENGTH=397 /DNA_ID=CAMNT_0010261391 /DNA_START=185 /DNA_END=1378 /DNA_ORIENTATION=+
MALSKTIEIHSITKKLEREGQKIYSLCVGEPDYQPPQEVIDATYAAAKQGLTKYTGVAGELSLRQAIAGDLSKRKGTPYSPDQIVVSNGAKQAVLQALMAVVSPGDKVIIPAPYWTSYPDMVKMCGGIPVALPTLASNNYELTADALRTSLQQHPDVSCIILCNPSNPSGGVASRKSFEEIALVLKDFPKVVVLSDEIYERLTYDGVPHTSMAAIDHMFERTITINGFSKSHSMTGYRIGYSASPTAIATAISKIQSQITSCASSISQHAATVALATSSDSSWMSLRVAELQAKRDLAYSLLTQIPHVTCPLPSGAFYLLPDVSHYYGKAFIQGDGSQTIIRNGHELCLALLKEQQVALVSGDAFGVDECIRISYATSVDVIEQSLSRLKSFLCSLQ